MTDTTRETTELLHFPFAATTLFDPPPEFGMLRAADPVAEVLLPSGDRAWLVTRYEDVRQLLSDPRFSRAAATRPGSPRLGPARPEPSSMMAMDPPDHTRLRKLVTPAFTRGRLERLRPRVQQVTDGLLDAMADAGPPADLVPLLARPLPIIVICEILGVPVRDRESFQQWTDTALTLAPDAATEVNVARGKLTVYLARLVDYKRGNPGDDLLSTLTAVAEDGDRLSEDELVSLAGTLITAGYHTVANTFTNAVLGLLRHPEQLARLRAQPELLANAVEELLRWTPGSVSGGTLRIATEDVELGGRLIRSGEAVLPSTTSGNRDAEAFPDPDLLDLARTGNRHIAFGPGIHHCLGAPLARIELQLALGGLLTRFPGFRLDIDPARLVWGTGMIRGLTALPVAW